MNNVCLEDVPKDSMVAYIIETGLFSFINPNINISQNMFNYQWQKNFTWPLLCRLTQHRLSLKIVCLGINSLEHPQSIYWIIMMQ